MLGDYDMIAYLNARSPLELNSAIDTLRRYLGPHILNFDLLVQNELHHWRQFSRGIYSSVTQQGVRDCGIRGRMSRTSSKMASLLTRAINA